MVIDKLIQFEKLYKLFDVTPSDTQETVNFKKISHDEISKAIQNRINQCTLLFGEILWTQESHGMKEDGADVITDFKTSNFSVGFQIKSYNDMQEKDFHQKLRSQIQQSKKHRLEKLFILFAADMTDNKQKKESKRYDFRTS